MDTDKRIYVAGSRTLIGAALIRELEQQGYTEVICPATEEPDLTDLHQVENFFARYRPEYVFLAAGKSAGIVGNQKYPAELIRDNLLVTCNIIDSAYRSGAKKLLYLASSCVYPKYSPQPLSVEMLLTGPLESTSEAYAVAKIAGIKLCQGYRQQYGANFISVIPGDAFGPGDDFSPEDSHVVAALIRRMHEAKTFGWEAVEIWGTGTPRRDFIFVDDLANACVFVMREYDGPEPINLGSGTDLSILELTLHIKEVVGFQGELRFDMTKPDGMPLKALDSSRLMAMGWRPRTPLQMALKETYERFLRS